MRVTYKLTLALMLGMSIVLAVHAYVRIQREVTLFESDMRRDASLMGRTLAGLVQQLWRTEGEQRVVQLLEQTSRGDSEVNIRWVWFDRAPGEPDAPLLHVGALAENETQMIVHASRQGDALYTYVAVPAVEAARSGGIEVRESLAIQRAYLQRTVRNVVIATSVTFLVSGLLAVVSGVRVVGRPVQRLVDMARRVGAGDLTARAGLRQKDEIGELAREMDAMCERLSQAFDRIEKETAGRVAALEQLRHADRLATVGQLATGLAHELGTPLNVVSGRARLIASGELAPPEVVENAQSIVEQAARMTTIIRQLLDFARRRSAQKAPVDLRVPIRRTVDMLSRLAERARVTLQVEGEREVVADVDATQMEQVVTNLVVNGVQAMPDGGTLRLVLDETTGSPPAGGAPRACARISVIDQGTGIAAADLPRVFEPFFTTKGVGEGTGLGLSVADGIIAEHGGWISVESQPGRGSTFHIHLPIAGASP